MKVVGEVAETRSLGPPDGRNKDGRKDEQRDGITHTRTNEGHFYSLRRVIIRKFFGRRHH